jgi:predicted phage-related endonuclease
VLSPDQIEIRRSGLGGSDIPAIFGLAYGRRAIDVYLEKIGEAPPFEGNERTLRGSQLESIVLGWYHEETGGEQWERPPTLRHPDREWQLLTPDAARGVAPFDSDLEPLVEAISGKIWLPREEAIELKTHGFHGGKDYGEEGDDVVPDHVNLQTRYYQSALALPVYPVVALLDTHLLRVFPIYRDLEIEGYILEEAESFWRRHVLERRPPDPDGSDSFKRYLEGKFADTGEVIEATNELLYLVDEFMAYKLELKEVKERHDRAKQELQLAMGPVAQVDLDGKKIASWKRDSVGKVAPTKAIKHLGERLGLAGAALNAELEQFRGEPTRRLLVKGRPQ